MKRCVTVRPYVEVGGGEEMADWEVGVTLGPGLGDKGLGYGKITRSSPVWEEVVRGLTSGLRDIGPYA